MPGASGRRGRPLHYCRFGDAGGLAGHGVGVSVVAQRDDPAQGCVNGSALRESGD